MSAIRLNDPVHVEMVREYAAILAYRETLNGIIKLPIDWRAVAGYIAALVAREDAVHAADIHASLVHKCVILRHHRLDIVANNGTIDFNICQTLAQRNTVSP